MKLKIVHFLLPTALLLAAPMLLAPPAALAQGSTPPGELDPSFGQNGFSFADPEVEPHSLSVGPTGKLAVAGSHFNGGFVTVQVFNANGSPDNSFSGDGLVEINFGPDNADNGELALFQPDGKLIVIGRGLDITPGVGNETGLGLARLNPNGSFDNSFSGDGKNFVLLPETGRREWTTVGAAHLLPNGKILVAGQYQDYSNYGPGEIIAVRYLARFNADGSLDTTFGDNGFTLTIHPREHAHYEDVYDMAVTEDGDIITVGRRSVGVLGHSLWEIAVYSAGGEFERNVAGPPQDAACAQVYGCEDHAGGVEIQPDGKIVIAGAYTTFSGPNKEFKIQTFAALRFNPDWSLDPSFDDDGMATVLIVPLPNLGQIREQANDLAIDAEGRIVLAGHSNNDFAVARLNPDGSPDTSFGSGDAATRTNLADRDAVHTLRLQADGKIVALGSSLIQNSGETRLVLARYFGGGAPDPDPDPDPDPGNFENPLYLPLMNR